MSTFVVKTFEKDFILPMPAILLWVAGIWPHSFNWIYASCFSLSTCLFIIFGEIGAIIHYWPDITAECKAGTTTLTGVRLVYIIIFMGINIDKFRNVVKIFVDEIWISPDENKDIYEECKRGMSLSNTVSWSLVIALGPYFAMPLIDPEMVFPYYLYFPFDVHKSIYLFASLHICCIIAGIVTVGGVVSHDTLMNYMILHTCARLDLLCQRIKNIGGTTEVNKDEDFNETSQELTNIVQEHCKLINFIEDLEELFSTEILMQFSAASMLICIMGIQLLYVQINMLEKIKLVLYLVTVLGQLYVNCYSGEKLEENSYKMGDSIYNSRWADLSTKHRISILMIIQRSHKPLHLTGAKFFNLSLFTFSAVLKSSFSYFALLKHLLEKKI